MIHFSNVPAEEARYERLLADIKKIKERMKKLAISEVKLETRSSFDELSALSENSVYTWGSRFTDLNYGLETRSSWHVCTAFRRLLWIAVERENETSPERRAAMEKLITRHLDFLTFYKFKCPNWWFNEVGVPLALSYLLVFAEEFIPKMLYDEAMLLLEPSSIVKNPEYLLRRTGANLTWFCMLSIRHGALTNNPNEIMLAIKAVADVAKPGAEGLQSDGSFFQHGRLLYSLGYGRSYLEHFASMLNMLSGTDFPFPEDVVRNVVSHAVDGVKYLIYKNHVNPLSFGREYVRRGAHKLESLVRSLNILAECEGLERIDDIRALAKAAECGTPAFVGAKLFDVARMLVLSTGRLYFAFQGGEPELCTSEIINGENMLGYNYSYGTATAAMREGDEYADVSPLIDYARIPGTTARHEGDEELLEKPNFTRVPINTDNYGGKCDGERGLCFLTTKHDSVSATVTAFVTPNGAVLLGAGISFANGDEVATTVDQSNAKGKYRIENEGKEVVHGGIRYTNLDTDTHFNAEIFHKSSDWTRNRIGERAFGTPEKISSDVFLLTVPTSPEHPAYAYAITAEEDFADFVTVVLNTPEAQAIRTSDGYVLAAFHKDGEVSVDGKAYTGKRGDAIIVKA